MDRDWACQYFFEIVRNKHFLNARNVISIKILTKVFYTENMDGLHNCEWDAVVSMLKNTIYLKVAQNEVTFNVLNTVT